MPCPRLAMHPCQYSPDPPCTSLAGRCHSVCRPPALARSCIPNQPCPAQPWPATLPAHMEGRQVVTVQNRAVPVDWKCGEMASVQGPKGRCQRWGGCAGSCGQEASEGMGPKLNAYAPRSERRSGAEQAQGECTRRSTSKEMRRRRCLRTRHIAALRRQAASLGSRRRHPTTLPTRPTWCVGAGAGRGCRHGGRASWLHVCRQHRG